jgi:hypothetical protein
MILVNENGSRTAPSQLTNDEGTATETRVAGQLYCPVAPGCLCTIW